MGAMALVPIFLCLAALVLGLSGVQAYRKHWKNSAVLALLAIIGFLLGVLNLRQSRIYAQKGALSWSRAKIEELESQLERQQLLHNYEIEELTSSNQASVAIGAGAAPQPQR